jgi:nicotinic acid mononucleotide adenylyltransferase
MTNLTLKIGEFNPVTIGHQQFAQPTCRKIECGWTTQPARSDDEHSRFADFILSLDSDLG